MTTTEKQIVRRAMEEVFSNGRVDLIPELYVPGAHEGIQKLVELLRGGFPDLALTIEHMIQEDNKVACRWSATGTHKGWFQGVPPTEARVTWTGTGIYQVDARIVAVYSNWDLYGLMNQLRAAMR